MVNLLKILPSTPLRIFDFCYQNIIAMYVCFVLFLNLPQFLNNYLNEFVAPTIYIVFLGMTAIYALVRYRDWIRFAVSPMSIWLLCLTAIYALNFYRLIYWDVSITDVEWINEVNRLQRQSVMLAIAFTVFTIDSRFFLRLFVPLSFVISVSIILDFFSPELFVSNQRSGRADGTYINANLAAEAAILCFILALGRLRGVVLTTAYLLLGFAVILTFSRSGIAGWLLVGAFLIYQNRFPKKYLIFPLFLVLFYTNILGFIEDSLLVMFKENRAIVDNLISRLSFFTTVSTEGLGAATDESALSRADIAATIWKSALASPWLGFGLGPDGIHGLPSHNLALEYWFTYGAAGLAVVIAMPLMLLVARKKKGLSMFSIGTLYFVWSSFFDHLHFTVPFWIIFFAISLKSVNDQAEKTHRSGSNHSRSKKRRASRRRKRTRENTSQTI